MRERQSRKRVDVTVLSIIHNYFECEFYSTVRNIVYYKTNHKNYNNNKELQSLI